MKTSFAQQVIKALTNALFGVLMAGVLVFTVISVRYQPPDPWLEPGEAVAKLVLNSVLPNGTFQIDDSILHTGEDFSTSTNDSSPASQSEEPAITQQEVEIQPITLADASQDGDQDAPACSSSEQKAINCSDPAVLTAVVGYNFLLFPDLKFFSYQIPVGGPEEDECDVAWRFRAKKEKSWRMYRDFRRFTLAVDAGCNVSVVSSGGWHSGTNAKHLVARKGGPFAGKQEKPEPEEVSDAQNLTAPAEAELIEDSIVKGDVSSFTQRKYLFYGRGGDHCKKISHYLWSFLCTLGEAQYLQRTLVVDFNLCLSSMNNPGHTDEDGKDFRMYFDFAHMKEATAVVEQKEFLDEWAAWNKGNPNNEASFREVVGSTVSPMDLREEGSTVLLRKFELPEPDSYWFRVCEGPAENVVQRPWHLIWKSRRIMDIVNAICGLMEWNFDTVHIVRGDKASNKKLWPNLDIDTSPPALISKLEGVMDDSRYMYIASNERQTGFFDSVKDVLTKVRTLDDFSYLWAKDSLWYNQTIELLDGHPAELDGYMRAEIDTEITFRAKRRFETFSFLTHDCKDGANTCRP